MVDVKSRKCITEGCGKRPSYGLTGTKTVEYCAQHAPDGMVNVKSRKCITEGCGKWPSYGLAGTEGVEYCAQHAPASRPGWTQTVEVTEETVRSPGVL